MTEHEIIKVVIRNYCEHNCSLHKTCNIQCLTARELTQSLEKQFNEIRQSGIDECMEKVNSFIRARLPRVMEYHIGDNVYSDMLNEDIREDLTNFINSSEQDGKTGQSMDSPR